jgi:hypothetical protein
MIPLKMNHVLTYYFEVGLLVSIEVYYGRK